MCIRDRIGQELLFVERLNKLERLLGSEAVVAAVSYTHLDVYKRQAHSRLRRSAGHDPAQPSSAPHLPPVPGS